MKSVNLPVLLLSFVILEIKCADALDFPPRQNGTLEERCERAGIQLDRCKAAFSAHPASQTNFLFKDITPHQSAVFRYGAQWVAAHPEFEAPHNRLIFLPRAEPTAIHMDDVADYWQGTAEFVEIDGVLNRKIPKSASSATQNPATEIKPNHSTKVKAVKSPSTVGGPIRTPVATTLVVQSKHAVADDEIQTNSNLNTFQPVQKPEPKFEMPF